MKILIVEPMKKPYVKEIKDDLYSLQAVVGGLIQPLYPFPRDNVALVCNDEGKMLGMPLNRALRDPKTGEIWDVIAGTFFIVGTERNEFVSLTDAQVRKYSALYQRPEMFLKMGDRILVFPDEPDRKSRTKTEKDHGAR